MLRTCEYCVGRGEKVFGHYDRTDQKYFGHCAKKSVNDRQMTEKKNLGLTPLVFWQVIPTRNRKLQTEIDPKCSKDFFFGLHLNLGAKFWTEIELLSLTKLLKNISPPRNLLNPQRIDAYEYWNK